MNRNIMLRLIVLEQHTVLVSFNGAKCTLSNMTHQHVSNLYYFTKYFIEFSGLSDRFIKAINAMIQWRFSGKRLPYKPHPQARFELELLRNRDMIIEMNKQLIIIDPKTRIAIGEVVEGEYFFDE